MPQRDRRMLKSGGIVRNQQLKETSFGLQVPENGMIPCPREMVLISLLPPFPPDFSSLPYQLFFLAAHGLHGLALAAHGLHGLVAFAAHGLHGLHGFFCDFVSAIPIDIANAATSAKTATNDPIRLMPESPLR